MREAGRTLKEDYQWQGRRFPGEQLRGRVKIEATIYFATKQGRLR